MKVNSHSMGFVVGTKVLMADGSQKAIENIKTGDKVLSFDQFDAFGELEAKKVLDVFIRVDRNPLHVKVDNSDIELTVAPGQLFINPGHDWKDAVNINEIIDDEGTVHTFKVSQLTRGKFQIYDIIVEDNHSLIANGIRVHNKKNKKNKKLNDNDDGGAVSNSYSSDYEESATYQNGTSKKKKTAKSKKVLKNNRQSPSGESEAASLMTSFSDSVSQLLDLIEAGNPTQLTVLRSSIQASAAPLIGTATNFITAVLLSSMSTYDKDELANLAQESITYTSNLINQFQGATVTASNKAISLVLLEQMQKNVTRAQNKLSIYTTTSVKKSNKLGSKINADKFKADFKQRLKDGTLTGTANPRMVKNSNGKYGARDIGNNGGGQRNDRGPGSGAGSSSRSTGGTGGGGSGFGGLNGNQLGNAAIGAAKGYMSGGPLGAVKGALGSFTNGGNGGNTHLP